MTSAALRLTLPTPPSANAYYRNFRGRMVLSATGRAYKNAVALRCSLLTPLSGEVTVTFRWYRGRKSGDLDNRSKPLLDALQGVAYVNDSQVVRLVAERYDDKGDPRVEVEVTPASPSASSASAPGLGA